MLISVIRIVSECYGLGCLFKNGMVNSRVIIGFRKLIVVVLESGMKVVVVNIKVILF